MRGNTKKTKLGEERKLRINKGVELMLHNRRNHTEPKVFKLCFGKMVSLLRREFHIYFEFSLDIKKEKLSTEN